MAKTILDVTAKCILIKSSKLWLTFEIIFKLLSTCRLPSRFFTFLNCIPADVRRRKISYWKDPKKMVHFCFEGKEITIGTMCCQCMWQTKLWTMTLSGMTPFTLDFFAWRMRRKNFQTCLDWFNTTSRLR